MSLYLGENKIADNTCSRNIGEIVASTIPLSDAGLHLLDGSLISSAGSYAKFVNYIAGLYNQTVPTSVTYYAWYHTNWNSTVYTLSATPSVGDHYFNYYNGQMIDPYIEGSTYPYYVTSVNSNSIGIDGEDAQRYTRDSSRDVTLTVQTPPSYFCSELDWQSSVSTYGVCGKFVYDSVNNTVRLPKITGFTEGTIDPTTLGDLTTAGLPNITGSITSRGFVNEGNWAIQMASGALNASSSNFSSDYICAGTNTVSNMNSKTYNFSASASSSIYGNSTTVQPQSIKVLYYIVIANSTVTVSIESLDVTEVGKAFVDLFYPVGSIYVGITSTCPLALVKGTWELVSSGRVLQGADSSHVAGSTIAAGLPNIEGTLYFQIDSGQSLGVISPSQSGLFNAAGDYNTRFTQPVAGGGKYSATNFNASRANSIYGNSSTVQPPAYCVNIWKRTA